MTVQSGKELPRKLFDQLTGGYWSLESGKLQIDPENFEQIDFCLPGNEKADIHSTAASFGLSVSEYLRTLHWMVIKMLKFEALK